MPIELPPGTAAYSENTPPPSNRQLLTLLALFVMGIGIAIALTFWLAGALVWFIPTSVEQQLGRAMVPIYEAQAQPSATQNTLNQLLDRLEAHLPTEQRTGRDYQVLYVPDATVNALAIPGDRIIIHQGLLAEVVSENELMMVLGHELGHFANRDHLRALSRQVLLQLSLSGIVGDFGSIGAIATTSISALANAQFSQQQEQQADRIGLTLLNQTYGHAAGATDFFDRLSQEERPGLAILATHPPSQKRVRNLERLIKQQGYQVGEKTHLPPSLMP
ncbi:peptidase m48 ste24p [Leptolyngbya sp. Heron Island J]|uniref:M48 family metallopeptidase n=1 Tax=Leptolyngbya sp. Heron Island J TaxID=1385935 RepID=UPI0003B98228|nr:M48 family metallopeptidase [Leptolyngbya sp. Heron Island J]ESA34797.1 peptidase m48 ste24p [Leptolyngbya sp. Heron Island J]